MDVSSLTLILYVLSIFVISGLLSIALYKLLPGKKNKKDLLEHEAIYRAIIETSADGFWISDLDGHFLEVNDVYVRMSGYSREELLTMRIPDVEVMESPEETEAHLNNLIKNGHDRFESYHRRKDGSIWPVEIVTNFWPINGGLCFVFITDITERKRIAEQVDLMAKVFQNSMEAMLITDTSNRIINVNSSFVRMTGYTLDEVMGKDPKVLSAKRQSAEFYQNMWTRLLNEGFWEGEVEDRRKDGHIYPKWLSITTVRNYKNDVVNFIASFTDITERKRAENEIRNLAFYDTLTGLHNRFSFVSYLEQELIHSERNDEQIALMFIDLDRFKSINDTLGHLVGDKLLVEVAGYIRDSLRESDLVARIGGDEFVVLLNDVKDTARVVVVAQKLIKKISSSYYIDGHELYTAPSIGISIFPDDGSDVKTLMQNADTAMYHAKKEGGGSFKFFDTGMNEDAMERLDLESGLHRALESGEFTLYYQLQFTRDEEPVAAEALIRWNHPVKGQILPDKFIPVAEETGMVMSVGQWVLETACRQLRKWTDRNIPVQRVAVNLSAQEFLQEKFPEKVMNIVKNNGIRPWQLELEITESTAMRNPERIISVMQTLKDMEIRLSIDDFGTGYSSLAYLSRLPIDQVKIDRYFIRDLESDPTAMAITTTTIELARKLNVEVVAEGVENKQQSEILKSYGCDLQQGYYYCKPLSAEEIIELLSSNS